MRRTLDVIARVFPERTPELARYNVVALYCVIAELQKQHVLSAIETKLHDWFVNFEVKRRNLDLEELLDESEANPDLVSYREKTSHSTDAAESVRWRMEFLLRNLLEAFPDLPRKDNQREFTHIQKMAIFRRDNSVCQLKLKCEGLKLIWDDCRAVQFSILEDANPLKYFTFLESPKVLCSATRRVV